MSLSVFSHDLSIKLPDTFIVSIKWNQGDSDYTVLRSCTQFQPPVVKYKKEIQNFGNNGYAFVIPDWEVDDVSFTFNEDTNFSISKLLSHAMQYLFDFSDDKWYYKENNIYEILVDVYDNNFNKIVYRYTYRYLKLVKYDNYQLDYSNDALTSLSLTFSFMYANEGACDIDPHSSNVPVIEDKTEQAPEPSSISQDIMEEYTQPVQDPNDVNTGASDGHAETGGQSAADAAAAALAAQKAKMEQQSKTEEAEPPKKKVEKETAATNPVDLNKLSGEDRIDELAYRMMRGQLDNGKPRYDKTYKAGYSETERAAAQGIVNQKDWEGLKERHDARVANKDTHYTPAEETAVAQIDYTPNKDIKQSRSADTISPSSESTGGQSAADAAALARAKAEKRNKSQDVAVNTKPKEQKKETQKPKQEATQVAKTEPKKQEEKKPEEKKQEPIKRYSNGKEDENGFSVNAYVRMAAEVDYDYAYGSNDKNALKNRNKAGYRGEGFNEYKKEIPPEKQGEFAEKYDILMKQKQRHA